VCVPISNGTCSIRCNCFAYKCGVNVVRSYSSPLSFSISGCDALCSLSSSPAVAPPFVDASLPPCKLRRCEIQLESRPEPLRRHDELLRALLLSSRARMGYAPIHPCKSSSVCARTHPSEKGARERLGFRELVLPERKCREWAHGSAACLHRSVAG
jgi:hypothetical protein